MGRLRDAIMAAGRRPKDGVWNGRETFQPRSKHIVNAVGSVSITPPPAVSAHRPTEHNPPPSPDKPYDQHLQHHESISHHLLGGSLCGNRGLRADREQLQQHPVSRSDRRFPRVLDDLHQPVRKQVHDLQGFLRPDHGDRNKPVGGRQALLPVVPVVPAVPPRVFRQLRVERLDLPQRFQSQ